MEGCITMIMLIYKYVNINILLCILLLVGWCRVSYLQILFTIACSNDNISNLN